ncbi:hypothetical protein STRTUCAR8_07748, partial [Streptomyces turgidiscabies Car8]
MASLLHQVRAPGLPASYDNCQGMLLHMSSLTFAPVRP